MSHQHETIRKTVPESLAGHRLDQALARMFPEFSRSRIQDWIRKGLVRVDGSGRRPRDPVSGGEAVELTPNLEPAVVSRPQPIDLKIAYRDQDVIVIDKPAGLVVHPGAGNIDGTLMNGLLAHDPALADLPRAGLIHRLDKDTSGLLIVARTLESHTALTRDLAAREVSRNYRAICCGVLTGGGRIDAPIARHPVDRLRMSVREGGRPAVTHYRVLERFDAHTLIEVSLESGRTHQIRVHFAWRRHPLVGDPVYGRRLAIPATANAALAQALRGFRRQALHAWRLAFRQPTSGRMIEVTSDPPADFAALVDALRRSKEEGGA